MRGDAVFVGYGIVAPESGWNDYAGLDAKGKIVVVLVNDPGLQDSTLFRGKILTYYGRWTYKIEEARRQGAAGLLLVHTTESATYPWTTVLSGLDRAAGAAGEPARLAGRGRLAARRRPRRGCSSSGGQDLGRAHGRRGAARASSRCRSASRSRARCGARSAAPRPPTCWAGCPGRGPLAKEAVLIGGHYDHFGIGAPVDGDSIYNGAEDNASGTAAVLAAAEAFVRSGVRTARSLVFVGFAAEESGLIGSQALADNPPIPAARHRGDPQPGRDEPLRPDPRRLGAGPRPVLAGQGLRRRPPRPRG